MTPLPKKYEYLYADDMPRLIKEWVKLYGVVETLGPKSNPEILRWAKEVGMGHIYKSDDIAWCGLAMAYVAGQAGWDFSPRGNCLRARNWLEWGNPVQFGEEKIGDVLIKARGPGFGHVCTYVGEDNTHFHVIGGNQNDRISIKRIPKLRSGKNAYLGARQCPWRISVPAGVKPKFLSASSSSGGSEG